MNSIVEIRNISKIFGKDGIKNLSFNIQKGSFHVLIGSNGAGKTTMIRTLLHLYQKYDGTIKINGINSSKPESLKGISYISEHALFPNELSAQRYLEWVGLLANKNINGIKVKIENLANKFGIKNILKKNPNKLSSGQKQKLLLIKILIEEGDLIILDEPTANLDPKARIIFFKEIKKLHNDGKSIFVCSHNLDEIEDKATWVTILDKGKIVYDKARNKKSLIKLFQEYALEGAGDE